MANFEPWGDGEVRDRRTGQILAVADFNEVSSPAEKAQFGRDVASRGLLTNQQGEMGSDLLDEEDGPDPDVTPAPRATPGRAEKASPVSRGGPSDDWLARARPLNPGVSDDELLKFHAQKQKKSGPLPSLESWLPRAQAANPDADALDLEEMWQEKYGAKGAPEKNPPDKPWYNDAKEVGRQIVAGAVVDLPRMAGQAMQALSPDGSSVSDYGKELQASAKLREAGWQPDMEGRDSVADAFIRGGRSIAPSLATVAAYLNPYGEVLGPVATVALFGGSQYQEEYDKVKAAGGTDEDARNAGLITGAIQGGGEAIANKLTLGVFGVSKGTAAKAGMTGVVGQATDASILKPWAKASGKAMIGEPATEIAQDVGTSMTERQYGLETPSLLDTAKDSGTAAMAMTALLAPLGLGGHYKNSQRAQAIDKVLSDPNAATPEERQTVVQMLHDEASTLKVPNADLWLQQATEDIQKQRPIRRDVTPTEQLQHGPYNTPQGPQPPQPFGPTPPDAFGPTQPQAQGPDQPQAPGPSLPDVLGPELERALGPSNDPQGPYRPTVRDVLAAPSLDDAIQTANDLLFSPAQEKRAGVEIPILPGREGVDVPPTTLPGRAFTPRTASEPDPRDQLSAERAGLLSQAGLPRQTDQAPDPTPMVDAPLQSASDIAYPPDQRNRMLTAAELVERERLPSKRPAQDPTILNGAEATPDAPIAPGQAFTPRTTPDDPRARLSAERAKLVAMRNAKAAPEPAPQATTAPEPITSTQSALPSATQDMPSQPDMPELASPAAPASQQHQENPPSPGTAPIEPKLVPKSKRVQQEVAKAKGAEQLSIDVPAEVIGSRPIIGREAQPGEAPLFSKAAQEAEPEQASLTDESPDEQEVWQMTKAEFLKPYLPKSEGGTDSPTSPIGRVERQASMKVDAEFHREQVEKAVKDGKAVPANVLKDYPELQPKAEPVAPAPEPAPEPKAPTAILADALRSAADQIEGKPKQAEAQATQYGTLAHHDALMKRMYDGEVTPEELQAGYASLKANKESLFGELNKLTKEKLIKQIGSHFSRSSDSKPTLIKAAYDSLLSDFTLGEGVSYSMGQGNYERALDKIVAGITPEKISAYADTIAKRRAEYQQRREGFANPQTLDDFDLRVKIKGEDSLTPEQVVRYDELLAAAGRAKRQQVQERSAVVQGVQANTETTLVETVHTKGGYPLFVVKLGDRVPSDTYKRLNEAAHKLGGRYSSYAKDGAIPGFTFKNKAAAEQFMAAAKGETVSAAPVREAVKADVQNNAVAKLREMAERLDSKAADTLNADRKTNTAKRASQASATEGAAMADQALAQTMKNLADAIESGEVTHLSGLRTKVQVEMLDSRLESAKREAIRLQHPDDYVMREREKHRPETAADAAHATFPDFDMHKENLQSVVNELKGRPGTDRLRMRFTKMIRETPGEQQVKVSREDAEAGIAKYSPGRMSSPPWQWTEASDKVTRLESMGITTLPELRAALREFAEYRGKRKTIDKATQLERALIGNKNIGNDFFPTPKAQAERMVQEADIRPGMKVLEPSAGNGNIATAIRAAGVSPDVAETSSALREILEAKGFNLVGHDFMGLTEGGYDRIVMNPPFSNGQDADHVRHAYDLLAPGGRLVAIVGEGIMFRSDAKATGFRTWLQEQNATDEKLDAGTFNDASLMATTGANARMVVIEKPDSKETDQGTALFQRRESTVRSRALPQGADRPLSSFSNNDAVKAHPDYAAAKRGDVEAAIRLVLDLVDPGSVEQAARLWRGATFVAPMAQEASGHNALPQALASLYAEAASGRLEDGLIQTNTPYHTGADAMQRVLTRATFDGPVHADRRYVLVDDVVTMGGTIADLANYVQQQGGQVIGVAVLTNALRSGTLTPSPTHVRLLERRFGDELRTLFGIDASAVTREEAGYLVGFRNIDALRARTATAVLDRQQRLAAKGLSKSPTRSVTSSASSFPRQPLISSNDVSPDRLINRPLSEAELHAVARRIDVGTKAGIAVVPFSGLPHFVQQEAEAQGYPSNEIRGVFHDGQVYLVQGNISTEAQAEETIFHEMYHAWVAGLLGDRKHASLSGIFQKLGGIETVLKLADKYKWTEARSIIKAYGQRKDLSLERRQSIIVDELLATMGQRNAHPGLKWWWSEMVGAMRGWLRAHGFAELARWNEADLAHLLNTARTADLRAGDSTSFMVEPAGQPLFQREGNSPSRSVANQTNTPAFKQWFGESKVVDADGKPLIVYHGTADDIESFNLDHPHRKDTGWLGTGVYLTSDSKLASSYSYMKGGSSHPRVMQLYAKIKNPFYATIQDKRRLQTVSHNDGLAAGRVAADEWTRQLMEQGHDGVILQYLAEDVGESNTSMEMVAFSPSAVKSATSNNGDFDAKNPSILFSRVSPQSRIIGDSGRAHTPAQLRAMQRTGSIVTDKTMKETVQAIWKDAGKKLAQGLVDQFSPVKDLSQKAYTLLRLSKGATGAFEALLHHGKLSIKDGAFDADTSGGVIETVFAPLGRESTDFLRWVAGNRAERLAAEGKENLFTAEDIAAFKSLADDTTDFDYPMPDGTTTRDRTLIYKDALKKFNAFNTNVLDMAEKSGLIDGDSRHLWEHEFYVPFYRAADEQDGGIRGMNIKSGVVRQEAFKQLKGGEQQLNDLLDNTLNNWAHLIDASAKNRAATATLQAAEKAGVAHKAQPGAKKTVWHMGTVDGKHGKVEYTVSDPALLDAISSLEYAGLRGPAMDAMSTMKHWLTIGVTASPFFKVRNLIRDSVQAIATSDLSYNPYSNIKKGIALTNRERQEYVSALAGGGLIRFGTMLEGSEAARVRQLIKQGSKDGHILDGEGKVRAFYDKYIDPAIAAYNDLGNRGEEINRMTLYDTLIKQGKGHAEASLMARDLLDFSMQGTWTSIRFLTQVVPFMNARIQGIAKLGRAAHDDPARFAIVLGATAVASLSLLAAYHDDDDWKKREDWDRNNFWWFRFAGEAFRIPKPFEIGAIATLAERSAELLTDQEMTGGRFLKVIGSLTSDQLAMNPIPQAVKPIIDLYANKDSFTDRPIETMGMERLAPSHRYRQNTSLVARGISTAGNALTGDHFPSPVQLDHVSRAYFGWLGSFVVGSADMVIRSASDEPTKPALDYWKVATGGMVASLDGAQSRYVSQLYEQARELEQAHATWRHLLKDGKREEAQAYREEHQDELNRYKRVEHVKKQETKLNERMRMIERSTMDRDVKRDKINAIRAQQDRVARQLTAP